MPEYYGVFNDRIEVARTLRGVIGSTASVEKLIKAGKFKSKEFCLVSQANPARPKNIYFTSIYFYEPLLLDAPLPETDPPGFPQALPRFVHPFKQAFPQRYLYYFPRVLVLQTAQPVFWLATKLISLFFKLVYQPYIRGTPPFRLTPKVLSVIQPRPTFSAVKVKEFFLSFLFGFRLPKTPRADVVFDLQSFRSTLPFLHEPGLTLTEDTHALLTDFCLSESRLQRFLQLFFSVVLERQTVVVHPKPGHLFVLLSCLIFPLYVRS